MHIWGAGCALCRGSHGVRVGGRGRPGRSETRARSPKGGSRLSRPESASPSSGSEETSVSPAPRDAAETRTLEVPSRAGRASFGRLRGRSSSAPLRRMAPATPRCSSNSELCERRWGRCFDPVCEGEPMVPTPPDRPESWLGSFRLEVGHWKGRMGSELFVRSLGATFG